eukprot:CFRG0039T1
MASFAITLSHHSNLASQALRLTRNGLTNHCVIGRFSTGRIVLKKVAEKSSTLGDTVRDPNLGAAGPLACVRVLDLTRILAGPYATMMMADLGADVIKVERTDGGDDTRQWKPPSVNGVSAYFLSVNRNKRSIAVNFKENEGQKILHDLVKQCDVVIENYIPGKLKGMGLDYDTLSSINPSLIYCSISGYGATGPYSQRPGYDVIVSAVGGLMSTTGPENGPPCKTGVALTDLMTGLQAYGAISAALFSLKGRQMQALKSDNIDTVVTGQHIEVSLLETQISGLANLGSNYLVSHKDARRLGTAHESIVPYQAFASSDGYIMIAALNNSQFSALCEGLDLFHLSNDPRYIDNERRVANRDNLLPTISDRLKTMPSSHWMAVFEHTNVACGPMNSVGEALRDEQGIVLSLVDGREKEVVRGFSEQR